MKIVALLPVRDEADIISQCINDALRWADKILILDTGSSDGTAELIEKMSKENDKIKFLGSTPLYYNENRIRGFLFNEARGYLNDGDWFVRLDADEFYHINPMDFIKNQIKKIEGVIYHQYINFEITEEEAHNLQNEENIKNERMLNIEHRRRTYTVSSYSEPRLCRYRKGMRWNSKVSFPFNAGLISRERIPIRHYPHRDPMQLERRCRLREAMMMNAVNRANWKNPKNHHWSKKNWKEFIIDKKSICKVWEKGEPLTYHSSSNHVKKGVLRTLQWIFYRFHFYLITDCFRKGWSTVDLPIKIDEKTQLYIYRRMTDSL